MSLITRSYSSIEITPNTTTRTLVHTVPANTQSFLYGGTISNIDAAHEPQSFTLEKEVGGVFYPVTMNNWVPYGTSLYFPTTVTLNAGDKLHVTVTNANKLCFNLSITKRTEV